MTNEYYRLIWTWLYEYIRLLSNNKLGGKIWRKGFQVILID
jgi:hypothetical protein